jgi:hypothetical protein
MLFKRRKFGFVFHHAKVVALKIVIGDVLHANLVVGVAGKSHKCFQGRLWMALVSGTVACRDRLTATDGYVAAMKAAAKFREGGTGE